MIINEPLGTTTDRMSSEYARPADPYLLSYIPAEDALLPGSVQSTFVARRVGLHQAAVGSCPLCASRHVLMSS